jgi:hypothetical protein
LIQWYEDVFARNPMEVHRNDKGEIQFHDTGDDLIDDWEEQIANGEEIDMWAAFSEKSKEAIIKRFEKAKAQKHGLLGK